MTTATKTARRRPAPVAAALQARVEQMEAAQAEILNAVKGLGEAFIAMRAEAHTLPMAVDPEKQIKDYRATAAQEAAQRPNALASSSRTVDLLNPRAGITGFQRSDVVRLKDCSLRDKIMASYRKRHEQDPSTIIPDEIYGVVRKFMYVTKRDHRKYRVQFEGIGADGCMEEELELAR